MEYALLLYEVVVLGEHKMSLSPYCNGICSATCGNITGYVSKEASLNPYCNGICSATVARSKCIVTRM